jgi:hypothetical protein
MDVTDQNGLLSDEKVVGRVDFLKCMESLIVFAVTNEKTAADEVLLS